LVIPAVPDRFEFVNPDIEPPKVIVPAPVIVPPVKVIPDTVPAVATEVTVPVLVVYPEGFVLAYAPISARDHATFPEPSTVFPVEPIVIVLPVVHAPAVVAVDALPVSAPTNVVEVTDDNPVKVVVAAAPNVNVCEPNDTEELARLALVMPAVPDKFEFVIPDNVPPRVKFPVEVTVPDKVMPETVPVPETEVTPLFTTFVAHDAVPVNGPVNPVAVTVPGNDVFPDPSNKVAVLVKEENTPVYCLTCIGSVPSSAVAISTKPAFVPVPPILIRN
jgi:hypothetical protein